MRIEAFARHSLTQSRRAVAPLSVQSGGSPMLPPINPTRPGDVPNASQATYFGAPPKRVRSVSADGTDGSVPKGVAPVTSNLLKSSPNAPARSYASPS